MVLEPVKQVFDGVPGAVKRGVAGVLHQAVALGRDANADAALLPVGAQLVAVVSLVADHGHGLQPRRQRFGVAAVGVLAGRGQQAADEAQAVPAVLRSKPRGVVDLGGQPAPAAANGLPSAAEGAMAVLWHLMLVLSTCSTSGSARGWEHRIRRSQTPRLAQRRNRFFAASADVTRLASSAHVTLHRKTA